MALLNDTEIEQRLSALTGWRHDGDQIVKTFELTEFVGSVEFVNKLVEPAEAMGHHPDLEISWDKVKVSLTTHNQGGLTKSDFELAGKVDALA